MPEGADVLPRHMGRFPVSYRDRGIAISAAAHVSTRIRHERISVRPAGTRIVCREPRHENRHDADTPAFRIPFGTRRKRTDHGSADLFVQPYRTRDAEGGHRCTAVRSRPVAI